MVEMSVTKMLMIKDIDIDDVHRSGRRGQLESREGGSREEEADRQRLEGQRLQSVSTFDQWIGGDEDTLLMVTKNHQVGFGEISLN